MIKKLSQKILSGIIRKAAINFGLAQETIKSDFAGKVVTEGMDILARKAGAEGAILLKNDGVLPYGEKDKVAVFGRCQHDWFYVGYGSGGDVNTPYKVNLIDGLDRVGINYDKELAEDYKKWGSTYLNSPDDGWWGHWPMSYEERKIPLSLVEKASKRNDSALVVIGRAAGEDRENKKKKGSYFLTDREKRLLDLVTSNFEKTVVLLDCGNIMDLSAITSYGDKISAILWVWQGGMESGNAVADLLCGKVNPSGKLTSTIAKKVQDYPSTANFGGKWYNDYQEDIFIGYRYFNTFAHDKILFPFGFGLSYTHFSIECKSFQRFSHGVQVEVKVTNLGKRAGKEVVQLYLKAPNGKLGKADKVLVAFAKTKTLESGESEICTLTVDDYTYSSFDDEGVTGCKNAYLLESGQYSFFLGNSSENLEEIGGFFLPNLRVTKQLEEVCGVKKPFQRFTAVDEEGKKKITLRSVPLKEKDLGEKIIANLPKDIPYTGDKGIKLSDVMEEKATMEDFVAQLDLNQLERLTRGAGYMRCEHGVAGNGGAFGGTTKSLQEKGIPPVITTDGPCGIRILDYASLLPCGTALASTWNESLIEELYSLLADEMVKVGSDVLLGPGMNIHRHPLCGRNFEYFSEDPFLSGKMASAMVKGIQSKGVSACPKHFACNNQETNRNRNDSVVSQRALREIYFKGFEICVKESSPNNIMTSYNKINGVWSHYNYDLSYVLREEWGYEGNIMTDWWMQKSASPEFPKIKDHAYRVRAGIDLMMPGNIWHSRNVYIEDGSLLETLDKEDGIRRGEIQRCAINVLNECIRKLRRERK